MDTVALLSQIRGRLIVSCQALSDEPLHGAQIMARMALAAQMGGAAGIRANGAEDIRAIRAAVNLPIIGLYKDGVEGVYITPTPVHAQAIIAAGADVIALDATTRPRPDGATIQEIVAAIHAAGKLALADVSTLDEALLAAEIGFDLAAPTLSGYTDYSPQQDAPDYDLLRAMVAQLPIPVIAEGRIGTPEQARYALECGAVAVVVGSAITRPQLITAAFVKALKH